MRQARFAGIAFISILLLGACGEEKKEEQAAAPADAAAPATAPAPAATPAPDASQPAATPAPAGSGQVNVFNWSDYIAEDTNDKFAALTGIKVQYDVFDSNEILETRLMAGGTGYDVVVPSGGFLGRQIQAGIFRELDQSKLPNAANLDPNILNATDSFDPGHKYSVPYFWGTTGIGYNVDKIKERMPDAPVDSLAMVFDPNVVSKFADCGVTMLDAPGEILQIALNYLGKDPHTESAEDYAEAEKLLVAVAPYIKYYHSSQYINDISSGEICLAIGWNGDFGIAQSRAEEAGTNIKIEYRVPKEGTILWVDNLAVPKDAPNSANAETYINYLLDPQVAANNANFVHYATPNKAALDQGLVAEEDRNNPAIYPSPETMARLFGDKVASQEVDRIRTRAWTKIKTGQ